MVDSEKREKDRERMRREVIIHAILIVIIVRISTPDTIFIAHKRSKRKI